MYVKGTQLDTTSFQVSLRFSQVGATLAVLGSLLLAGCATTGGEPNRAPVYQSGGAPVAPAPEQNAPAPAASPAVVALLQDSQRQNDAGQPARAAALLERALRIEPRNATLWQRLADVRLRQGRAAQAESLALKSNSLAGTDTPLQARNWQIIAQARRNQGNAAGARRAQQRAEKLGSGSR